MVVTPEHVDNEALTEGLKEMLLAEYPKWWLPDGFEFIDEIPKTATGKFSKKDLREMYAGQEAELLQEEVSEDAAPEEADD
jgi:fatty-acyl-CoA synthase